MAKVWLQQTGVVSKRLLFKRWGWSRQAKNKVQNNKSVREPRVMWRA